MRVKAYSEDDVVHTYGQKQKTIDTKAMKMVFQRRLIDGPINRYYLTERNYERYKKKRNILRGFKSRCRQRAGRRSSRTRDTKRYG